MKFADRLKVASTGTSAATLTLGAAVTGGRTLAQCIADGDLAVNDVISLWIDDGAGNWEDSLFTITSSTVVTRSSVQRSSAGGTTAPTYSGAALTVYNSPSAAWLSRAILATVDINGNVTGLIGPSGKQFLTISGAAPNNSDGLSDGAIYLQNGGNGTVAMYAKVSGAYQAASGSSITPALLQIATSTFAFNAKAAATAFGCKSIHTASEALTAIKVVHANWYVVGGNAEQGTTSTATIKCTIEYPIGSTKTQFLYGGSLTGNIPELSELESDFLSVNIPKGSEFAIYSSWTNSGGVPYFSYYGPDGRAQGMSNPTPDLTVPGSTGNWTTTATIGGTYAGPIGIVGMSTNKAVLIMGDSISVGRGDSNTKYQGFFSRAFSPVCATGHGGSSGDRLSAFVTSHARRVALSRYYTHVAFNFGINDTTAGGDATTIANNMNTAVKYFTDLGKKVAVSTLGPVSTDTANTWNSTSTQTTHATNSVRASINTTRLSGMPGVVTVYDINPAIENTLSPEDGIWKPGQTGDGTHENATGYANVAALINPALLLNA